MLSKTTQVVTLACLSLLPAVANAVVGPAPTKNICSALPADTCSYTGINGSCQIEINRVHPITPMTIYMKPGAQLTVELINGTPLETYSLDIVSSTAVARPDSGLSADELSQRWDRYETATWKQEVVDRLGTARQGTGLTTKQLHDQIQPIEDATKAIWYLPDAAAACVVLSDMFEPVG
jgi:hypothetical protein